METINFLKSLKLRDKVLLANLSLFLVVALSVFVTLQFKNKQVKVEITPLDSFDVELEKICPYYEPDGVSYKKCLYELKDKRMSELEVEFNRTINKLQTYKEFESDPFFFSPYMYKQLIESLQKYKKIWWPFSEAKCEIENTDSIYGSGHSGFLMTCELREIYNFMKFLEDIYESYSVDLK